MEKVRIYQEDTIWKVEISGNTICFDSLADALDFIKRIVYGVYS